ncbi:hypothetical protein [Planococcus maitriensis]|uniref:Uncharacterized protein n=1 Tax=Planococcus maitriensis TaxID=221799 RepID=A0A365KAK1_9BACL|nr:hypothetical protein [Planococcus maitriensis]RAZ69684.1 hypothetical protein DP119_03235 [Planococcus maitriensis]
MSMQKIEQHDLVRDEYGNYYKVVGLHKDEDTLKAIEISNLYFETSFQYGASQITDPDKPVGVFLQEKLNEFVAGVESRERPVYGIKDLMVNKIEVYAVDITQPHPKREETV